jgi:hypothetical protein
MKKKRRKYIILYYILLYHCKITCNWEIMEKDEVSSLNIKNIFKISKQWSKKFIKIFKVDRLEWLEYVSSIYSRSI